MHPGQATTGGLLLAYGSGGALMLFLLGWCGAALIARLRRGQAFGERLRRLAGGAMLASVALIASGGDRYLQSAGGLSQALEQRLAARLPQPEQRPASSRSPRRSPVARCPLWRGGSAWINSPALTPERLKGKVVLVDFWTRECINCQHTLPYVRDWANKYRAAGLGGDWRSYPGISLGAFVAPAAPGGEGLADNLSGGGG